MDYKEILKGIVNIINTTEKSDIGFANICTYIGENCPELKESEDEKIRKWCISHFRECFRVTKDNVEYKEYLNNKVIPWLEKQGEQKPVDNVGSKFKVEEGKWYVCTQTFVLRGKIVIIKGQTYQAEKDNVIKGENGCRFIDRHDGKASDYFRSWTIQDAKDGDVLYFNNDISGFHSIGLFKRLASKNEINGNTYRCYARYGGFNEESKLEIAQNNNELHHFGTKAYPATKEQRDTLMKAMTDAGWKFDFKKKELMKIEKNTDVNHEYFSELLENDDSKDINDYAYQVAYCISHDWLKETATWDDVEKACKLGAEWNKRHHKSAWSDEDKKMIGRIRSIVEKYAFSQSAVDVNGDLCEKEYIDADNWLKSLKERYFWKPSDTQIRALEYIINNAHNTSYSCKIAKELLEQLRKLK